TPRVLAEGVVEPAEVWKIWHIRDQALNTSIKGRFLVRIVRQHAVQFARHVRKHLDQIGNVAARVIDVSLKQDTVTRGLVQLDIELACQQTLERSAIETGRAAQQSDASRI